jgi:hypothetical protein
MNRAYSCNNLYSNRERTGKLRDQALSDSISYTQSRYYHVLPLAVYTHCLEGTHVNRFARANQPFPHTGHFRLNALITHTHHVTVIVYLERCSIVIAFLQYHVRIVRIPCVEILQQQNLNTRHKFRRVH